MKHIIGMVLITIMLIRVAPVAAQSSDRCFPETSFCMSGPIRAYWEQHGGLPVFGFPIAAQGAIVVEGIALQAQWFERGRIELHPDQVVNIHNNRNLRYTVAQPVRRLLL